MPNRIIEKIQSCANKEFATHHLRFFKTGKGEYGEGDKFYGLKVPELRTITKAFSKNIDLKGIQSLIENEYHEVRFAALILATMKYTKGSKTEKSEIFDFYLANLNHINNWDLVDVSAAKIIGDYLYNYGDRSRFFELAESDHLWSERVSVVGSHYFIKKDDYSPTLELCERFLGHDHDLMHKATGWMLREVGKRDISTLRGFLDKHCTGMPRTMLRYSIEKLAEDERQKYLRMK